MPAPFAVATLPIQLQSKLELPRIECRRWLARICVKRADVGNVEPVYQVEYVHDAVELHAFRDVNPLRNTEIAEDCPWLEPGITSEISVELTREVARKLEETRRREL